MKNLESEIRLIVLDECKKLLNNSKVSVWLDNGLGSVTVDEKYMKSRIEELEDNTKYIKISLDEYENLLQEKEKWVRIATDMTKKLNNLKEN